MAKKMEDASSTALPIEKRLQLENDLKSHVRGIQKALSFFPTEERRRISKDIAGMIESSTEPESPIKWT